VNDVLTKDRESRPWTPAEREAAIVQLGAVVEATAAQWRAAMGLTGPVTFAPPQAGGVNTTFLFDLRRIDPIASARPVFVLGEARSGTTAMLRALTEGGGGFFAWAEGHLFSALPPLLSGVRIHLEDYKKKRGNRNGDFALDHFDVYRSLNALVRSFDAQYADATAAANKTRWADKTPDVMAMIALPLLARVYPKARFLFMHRHPIKLMLSRQKKFPTSPIESGITAWASTMAAWRELKKVLEPGTWVEIAQADLATRSGDAVARLREPLGLNDDQCAAMAAYLHRERPESTGSVRDDAEVYLDDVEWPAEIKDWFRRMCGAAAGEYGYRLDRAAAPAGASG
jgi:hypothetical protein